VERIKNNFAEGLKGIRPGKDPENLRALATMRFVFICLFPLECAAIHHQHPDGPEHVDCHHDAPVSSFGIFNFAGANSNAHMIFRLE